MVDQRTQEDDIPTPTEGSVADSQAKDGKTKKRSLFGLGKKKTESSKSGFKTPPLPHETSQTSTTTRSTTSPPAPSSPNRALSASPRISSPARSQIFERDVQDSTVLPAASPAIPTHIQTENHIPPVLDDASEAITNAKLDPDTVEIVTHNSHQPAAVTVTGTHASSGNTPYEQPMEWTDELASFANRDNAVVPDSASNYGSLDSADVRRLSFISFADVVQSEHGAPGGMAGSRDSIHLAGLTSLPSAAMNRSPSPIRSPVSSQGGPGTSPPTSNPGSVKGFELSPSRKPIGSPGLGSPGSGSMSVSGDLNIETMTQALRRTGSTDMSHVRSIPTSPIEGLSTR